MEPNLKSELYQAELAEVSKTKTKLIQELYQGGPIQQSIIRKMRIGVEPILRKNFGEEFASSSYGAVCHLIIKAGLAIQKPELFRNVLDEKQIETVKTTYPLQLQMITSIIDGIDEIKREYQVKSLVSSLT